MPPRDKLVRCRYFNDLGWPRYNPTRTACSNSYGCRFGSKCRYAHPDEEGWNTAKLAQEIPLAFYPDGIRPVTPEPTPERRRRDSTQLDPYVKQEYTSPKLPTARSNSIGAASRHMSVTSSRESGGRRHRSPTPVFTDPFDKQRRDDGGSRDRSRDRERDRQIRSRREQTTRGSYRDDDAWDRRNSRSEYGSRRDLTYTRDRDRYSEDRGRARSPPPYSAARRNLDDRRSRERKSPRGLREVEDNSSRGGKKRSKSPSLNPPRTPSQSTIAPALGPDLHSASTHSAIDNTKKEEENAMAMVIDDSSHNAQNQSTTSHIPHPMPPPPLPLFLETPEREDAPRKAQLSAVERGRVWEERLKLLTTAISARREARDFGRDVEYYKGLQNSSRYNINEQRTKIDAALALSEKQAAAATLRVKEAQDKLHELDFWPVRRKLLSDADSKLLPPFGASGSAERDWEEDFQKIKKNVTELHDEVSRLDQQLREVTTFVNSRTRAPPLSGSNTTSGSNVNEMDWEPTREAKRRRTGMDSSVGVGADEQDVLDIKSIERIIQRIEKLEALFEDTINLYVQDDRTSSEEIAAQVELAIEAARERGDFVSSQDSSEGDSGDASKLKEEKKARLAVLEENYGQLNKEVDELTSTVASYLELAGDLRVGLESHRDECARIDQERNEIRAQLAESRSRVDELHASLQKQIEETATLRTALEKAQIPPPPLVPTPDELSSLLFPRLLDAIRPEIMNQLKNTREELVSTVRAESPSYNYVRGYIDKLLRLPEVTPFLERWGTANGIMIGNDVNGSGGNSAAVNGRTQEVSTPVKQAFGPPSKSNLF